MPDDLLPRGLHTLDGVKLLTLGKSTVTAGGLLTGLLITVLALLAARFAAG